MKRFLFVLSIIFLMAGTSVATDFKQFTGSWVYKNAGMDEIKKITVEGSGKYNAQVKEKCNAGNCDQGWHSCNSYSDGHLSFNYQNDSSKRKVELRLTGANKLEVKVNTRYTDNSGRPAADHTYIFRRLVLQQAPQQTPMPMDSVTPQPMDQVFPTAPAEAPTGKY
ncbi:MAG: hypothetical protein K9L30_06935 [Desulfobacterales bacterium]|nr:hypothetical protein [Desulfobacterales bacterium]